MSLSALTTWEVRTDGSDNSGGGFVTGASGTDRSQQAAAHASGTNLTVDAITNTDVAPDGYTPVSADVGNIIQITAGAGFTTGFYEIVSIQSGKWRLDRSPAAVLTSGGTWAMGGALASPGKAGGAMVAGNDIYIKSGTYTVTSATTNIAGGCVSSVAGASASNQTKWYGYQTTRGDGGTKPIIKADGVITTFTLFTTAGGNWVENIEVDGNSRTTSRGFSLNSSSVVYKCRGRNCTNSAFSASAAQLVMCEATGCATAAVFNGGTCYGCVAYSNSITGFSVSSGGTMQFCLSVNNTSGYGFLVSASGGLINCTAYGNGLDGFRMNAGSLWNSCINCIAVNNSAYGFNGSAVHNGAILYNCAGYNNTSGNINSTNIPTAQQIAFSALSASPFNDAAGGDFSLNMTASAGDSCRQGGIPGVFPGVSTTGYPDIGCVQEGGVRAADITAIQSGLATSAAQTTAQTSLTDIQARIPAALTAGGNIKADALAFSGDTVAADNAESFFDGTGYAGTNNVMPTVTNTATLASRTAAQLVDDVWDEGTAAHTTPFTMGGHMDTLATGIVAMAADLSNVVARIGTFAGTGVNTILGFFRALLRKDVGITTPSDVGGAYDHTTDSQEALRDRVDALPTAAEIATALLATAVTQSNVTADTTITVMKALLAAWVQAAGDWSISGTILTLKNADGTTFRTFDLDSATAPTSRT